MTRATMFSSLNLQSGYHEFLESAIDVVQEYGDRIQYVVQEYGDRIQYVVQEYGDRHSVYG